MAVRVHKDLPAHGVEEALERPQGPVPLRGPALQAGHDRPVLQGEEPGVLAEAEGTQGVEGVYHVHGVAAGADHAGGLLVLDPVLLEVPHGVAALLDLHLHVGDDVLESSLGDAAHVVWEEDDVSVRHGVLMGGHDVGDVYL